MKRCDDRGYNALETAVLYHYKDICEILLTHDKSIDYYDYVQHIIDS